MWKLIMIYIKLLELYLDSNETKLGRNKMEKYLE
jgi:hypothetical protein